MAARLSSSARRGYGLGSVATGSFGTVPGLLLLPYLTDRLGVAAGPRGARRLPPEGLGRPPQPGRRPDQRPVHEPRRAPPPLPPARRARAGRGLRPALLGPDLTHWSRDRLGRRPLPRLRHRLRVLPGPLRRDAGRDDRRLRRAHAPHDVAGRRARARHPRQRGPLAGRPRRARHDVGVPRRRPLRRRAHRRRHRGGLAGHPLRPDEPGRHRRREPARPAARRRGLGRVPHPARRLRPAGPRDRGDARRRRLRRPRAARAGRCLDDPLRLLRRAGPARHPAVAARRRAAREAHGVRVGLGPPRRGRPRHPVRDPQRCRRDGGHRRGRRRRVRGLPDVPPRDAPRRRRGRHRAHRRGPRRHLHRGLDRGRDPRPRPRPAALRGRAGPRRVRLVHRRRCRTARLGPHGRRPRASPSCPPILVAVSLLVLRRYRLDPEVSR